MSKDKFLSVIQNIHTTVLGELRIKRNLGLKNIDVIEFCKSIIQNEYEKYKVIQDKNYVSDFDRLLSETNQIENKSHIL